jgi:hypothetical protein
LFAKCIQLQEFVLILNWAVNQLPPFVAGLNLKMPLQVDTLMSPHTRSLYAHVGESAFAYESPSKDLTAINNRLKKRLVLEFNRL